MKPEAKSQAAKKEPVPDADVTKGDEDVEMAEISEEQLQDLFAWIDEIPLTRPKRNITRDFADGVMVAEIVKHFIPKLVEIHNYTPANSMQQKMSNWGTLNRKVFSKINYNVPENVVRQISGSKPGVVEVVLYQLRRKIEMYTRSKNTGKPTGNLAGVGFPTARPLPQISPDGYINGQEVGSFRAPGNDTDRSDRHKAAKGAKHPPAGGGGTQKMHSNQSHTSVDSGYLAGLKKFTTRPVPRTKSLNHVNETQLSPEVRLLLEEKEQALLASQETVQILQAKVRRLEHLLHLKDIRIEDLTKKSQREGHYAS
ncbi:sperm flagellar protein 1-like isoform X2 [Ptychodera flava]|uniref:sperm flagellar protein 1-like isoform X2 n=1 Tax=Ptychodera flava TaxID=63121 RepID=UPI00396A1E0F